MNRRAMETVRRYRMLDGAAGVLAAVSGGADSMALLYFLRDLTEEYKAALFAAHVNHGLRGEESERDRCFVEEACERLSIPLKVISVDVTGERKSGQSVETAARELRYAALRRAAADFGADRIATGHNADDNAETVLLHLFRGTGLQGFCGIPPVREELIRPLLDCTRDEIEAYCRERGIDFVTDSTNLSEDYSRNLVRLRLTPVIRERLNPSFARSVSRMTRGLRQDMEYLTNQAEKALADCKRDGGIDAERLLDLHPALSARVLRAFYSRHEGAGQLESVHLDALTGLLKAGETSSRLSLPGELEAVLRYGILRIERPAGGTPEPFRIRVLPGNNPVPGGRYALYAEIVEENLKIHKIFNKVSMDYDRIQCDIIARSRREGDRYRPAGRGGSRSVKRLFIDAHIPADRRELIPVVEAGGEILWVPGYRENEAYSVTENTRKTLLLSLEEL